MEKQKLINKIESILKFQRTRDNLPRYEIKDIDDYCLYIVPCAKGGTHARLFGKSLLKDLFLLEDGDLKDSILVWYIAYVPKFKDFVLVVYFD